MRVGFDIGPITRTPVGVGNYSFYLLKHLVAQAPDVEFVGFSVGVRRPVLRELEGAVARRWLPVPARAAYRVWDALGAPKVDRLLGGADVYHATNFFLPPVASARRVLTIHDLTFLARPELCSPKIVGPFSSGIRRFAHEADAILACSESTKRDVVRLLDVAPEKVHVTHEAVDEGFRPVARDEAAARLRERYGIRTPFLLFVGTLEPRKNVPGLLRAFSRLTGDVPHSLVLVGATGWNFDPIFATIAECGLANRVVRPGYVPHADLPCFYSAADAFVFPTFYEGFGLPLLEAMTCGCPVVASDTSSVPEVTGDAALLVHSVDEDGIASAIRRILEDEGVRESCVARGRERARAFSWESCARATLDVYRSLAS